LNDYGLEIIKPYVCINHVEANYRLVFEEDERKLIAFAKRCVERLLAADPDAVAYAPILRVDIMRMQDGRWVVNEFESLEALTDHKKDGTGTQDNQTQTYFQTFWNYELQRMLN